jgi:hypothetical protein
MSTSGLRKVTLDLIKSTPTWLIRLLVLGKSGVIQKSDNLQYNTLVCWFAGTNDSLNKRLMFQVLFFS